MNTGILEKKLTKAGYSNLFLTNDEQLDSIWRDGKNKSELEQIVNNKNSSLSGRFLANEVLGYYKVKHKKENSKGLAEAYVYALEQTNIEKNSQLGLNANLWGFLYELDDSGHLGKKLIAFGEEAVPFLIELLNDNGGLLYEGSKEATIGNAYRYRIKDFAAFYLSKIKDIPITFYQDLEERDREIERFKKSLNTD